jgi:hypothetical protein
LIKRNQEPEHEQLIIELKDKMVVLNILPFDTDIQVDDLLKIDYHNIIGEILTFNVLFNRIANLKAEQENIVSVSKMDMEAYESQLLFEKRKQLINDGNGKPTEAMVDAMIKNDPNYKAKKTLHFEKVKNLGYLDSLYWSAQNKCGLLKVLSDKLKPEEFSGELLQDTVNGVMVKATKKLI